MGLTKQYLAYRPVESFNLIASGRGNVNFVTYNSINGRYALAPAAENVIIWDFRLSERLLTLRGDKEEVTALRASPDRTHVAVGYRNGVVQIFDLSAPNDPLCSMALHKSAITVLRYDALGTRLLSGSLDTDLVEIDIIEQAGKCRLVGHSAPVTDAHFFELMQSKEIAVSCSRDTQIKFWNLETQFCFKSIVDNRTEMWGLAIMDDLLIAGCCETTMNVYKLRPRDTSQMGALEMRVEGISIDMPNTISPFTVTNIGCLQRAGKGRVVNLCTDPSERVISCHGTDDLIESFYLCSEEEAKKRMAKRIKKARKEALKTSEDVTDAVVDSRQICLSDQIRRLDSIKTKKKIKSIDILLSADDELRVLVNLANNTLVVYSLNLEKHKTKNEDGRQRDAVHLLRSITMPGHHSEVRSVCFSSDSLAIGSGSGESFKLWDRQSLQSIRTVPTEYVVSSLFAPGDRYVLLGLKSGKLAIVDVGVGEIIEEIPAHEGELWALSLLPDQMGCVSGSGDKTVKFWTFELVDSTANNNDNDDAMNGKVADGNESATKVLSLLHKNTLSLEETVLCLRVSPNMKYLAVGLIDSTVKIFFLDTFKFFLSLYGHKLPVMCMDISYDSTLIVTGSDDRNIKIWGLDFGDCHRSLFAHDHTIMSVQFIPNTHMFFSCGRDGKIKQWDADSFEKIITLPGHIGEAYNLAVSANGRLLVTCGSDRTLRLFERTDEIIVLQDVQEEEREEMENQQLATGEESVAPTLPGLQLPSRKTVGAEKAADSIFECLQICKDMEEEDGKSTELHPLMRALEVNNADDFLLEVLSRIRPSDLEEALLLLPFTTVIALLERMPSVIEKRCDQMELLFKVIAFVVKVHMKPITGTRTLKTVLLRIVRLLKADVRAMRDVIGLNFHTLQLLQYDVEEREEVQLFREAVKDLKKRDKKRREATKRTLVQLK